MFEAMYRRPSAIKRHRAAPLLDERLRYLKQLASEQLGNDLLRTIANHLLVTTEYLDLASRPGETIRAAEIDEAAIRWSANRKAAKRSPRSHSRFVGIATRWLQFLGRWKPNPPTHGFADHIAAYSDHMRVERGLAPATVFNRCWTVGDFLPRMEVPLNTLTISELDGFVSERFSKDSYARVTVAAYIGVLRDFFRFAERQGWCQPGLAASLRGPRIFPQEGLPSGPSWEIVQQLVANCEGGEPVNIRNKAILLLLSVYGLRAGEIIRLKLDDIDWKEDRITVQRSKNHRRQVFPLCQTVGLAISRYLRTVRPTSDYREVFLTMRARFRPLSRVGLTAAVSRKLKALDIPLSHYGPHALRHACATRLLADGLSFKEIGDLLGHRLPETTAIYAKVDLAGLREVADFDLGGLL